MVIEDKSTLAQCCPPPLAPLPQKKAYKERGHGGQGAKRPGLAVSERVGTVLSLMPAEIQHHYFKGNIFF